jgi:hypothetical protein
MTRAVEGARRLLYMHNAIMGDPPAPGLTVDHRDTYISLDNRRKNLRWASVAQQAWNQGRRVNNTSGFKGVSRDAHWQKWVAAICHDGADLRLGAFDTAEDAARAYDVAALRLYGDFACLNFPAGSSILAEPTGSISI